MILRINSFNENFPWTLEVWSNITFKSIELYILKSIKLTYVKVISFTKTVRENFSRLSMTSKPSMNLRLSKLLIKDDYILNITEVFVVIDLKPTQKWWNEMTSDMQVFENFRSAEIRFTIERRFKRVWEWKVVEDW